jgi:hypothetical protein
MRAKNYIFPAPYDKFVDMPLDSRSSIIFSATLGTVS